MRICGIPESYNLNGQTIAPYEAPSSLLSVNTPEQIGKIGTDIVDNKCSWCINVALSVATSEQRKILEDNYGRKNAKPEAAVKALYEEIGLRERYRVCEESAKERLDALIAKIPEPEAAVDGGYLKRGVFTSFLNKIYKRTK